MSRVVDKILISGLQCFEKYGKLNPVDIKINDTQIISSLSKYGKYRLKITSLLISTSFNQTTDVMLITSNRLNDAKKALINGKIHNILGVIDVTEETNFNLINETSRWLKIIFKESNRETKHFSFEVMLNSLQDLLSFSYSLVDSKGYLLLFW